MECMYEEENFWRDYKKHKNYALHSFKLGIITILCLQTEAQDPYIAAKSIFAAI